MRGEKCLPRQVEYMNQLGEKIDAARTHVEGLGRKIESLQLDNTCLRAELDLTANARDRALYWLLWLCDASKREQWPLSPEAEGNLERVRYLLFEHNIFTDLPEPDNAILRLMEIVAAHEEGTAEEEAEDADARL